MLKPYHDYARNQSFFNPMTGGEHTVELPDEDHGQVKLEDEEYSHDLRVVYRIIEGRESFELIWALDRVRGNNETKVEENGTLELFCPNCGSEVSASITEYDEFVSLGSPCDSCGDTVELIRDQPSEIGLSQIINYEFIVYDI